MSNPSLLCVPYRFKTSKLYSQIPDSGLGDFTVTRSASNSATRVNAQGFIETVADNVPRLDYPLGGITAGCPALLVEPSAINLALRSNEFRTIAEGGPSNAWTANDTVIISVNNLSPDGTNNATRIRGAASPTNRARQQVVTGTSGVAYVGSAWIRRVSGTSPITLRVGDAGSTTNILPTSTWQRYSFSSTPTTTTVRIGFVFPNDTDEFEIWGAQLETGSVATSYIPTAASPVTRGAETISKTGVSSLIGQTQGTIYCEFAYFGRPINRSSPLYLRQSSLRGMSINSDSINTGIVFGSRNDGGSTFITLVPGALQLGTYYKIAIGYDAGNTPAGGQQANGVVAYVNGVQVATGTLRVPDAVGLSEFRMYSANSGNDSEIPNIRVRAHTLYPTRLPNTGPLSLQSLTQ